MKKVMAILAVIIFFAVISTSFAVTDRDKNTWTGANTWTGTETHSGAVTLKNIGLSIYSKVIDLATWAVSTAEKLYSMWIVTSGSNGTSVITVDGGYTGRLLIVRNASNGILTIKESGQTGISIAKGTTAVIMHNGTDYIRITADATH